MDSTQFVKWIFSSMTAKSRLMVMAILFMSTGCSIINQSGDTGTAPTPVPPAVLFRGSQISGAWTPSVPGTGSMKQKGQTTFSYRTVWARSVGMVRFQDSWGSKTFTVDLGTFDADEDFGYDSGGINGNGSLTLTADVFNYPYSSGGAYPVLAGLQVVDTNNSVVAEFVNTTNECTTQSMWVCQSGSCSANANCTVQSGSSSFFSRNDWDQHQMPPFGYASVNTFPRCKTNVTDTAPAWTGCGSGLSRLPSGRYIAKYVLMSDRNISVATGTADVRVRIAIKRDPIRQFDQELNGAINLNVILVGDKNVNDSHTPEGKRNLNLLFGEVNRILYASTKISIGNINVYEWYDRDAGDYYSQMYYYQIGDLFMAGSQGVAQEVEDRAINVFIVSDILVKPGSGYTILGLAGAILGPPENSTETSGIAVSTNDDLATFNSSCSLASCPRALQEESFIEMGATVAHELGHYLGLNHPSEEPDSLSEVQRHDQMTDTPTCAARSGSSGVTMDQRSCYFYPVSSPSSSNACETACKAIRGPYYSSLSGSKTDNYCPTVSECQFNHLMWFTTKNRVWPITGDLNDEDGNLISDQSSALIQWNPFVQ